MSFTPFKIPQIQMYLRCKEELFAIPALVRNFPVNVFDADTLPVQRTVNRPNSSTQMVRLSITNLIITFSLYVSDVLYCC